MDLSLLNEKYLPGKRVLFRLTASFPTAGESLLAGTVNSANDALESAFIRYSLGSENHLVAVEYRKIAAVFDPNAPEITIGNFTGKMFAVLAF